MKMWTEIIQKWMVLLIFAAKFIIVILENDVHRAIAKRSGAHHRAMYAVSPRLCVAERTDGRP